MVLNAFASSRRNPTLYLIVLILLYIIVLSYLSILKHNAFMSTAWDLGIYEQVLWSTANTGRVFWYTPEILINPSCNFFGIHFSPFLFVILPVYYVFQSTETLLVLQVSFLALGAVPLYKIAKHENLTSKQALVFVSLYKQNYSITILKSVPSMWEIILYYLIAVILLEFVLRVIHFITKMFSI